MTSPNIQQDLFGNDISDSTTSDTTPDTPNTVADSKKTNDLRLLLTPNNRLARAFAQDHSAFNEESDYSNNVRVSKKIYSLGNYEKLLWDQLLRQSSFLPACKRVLNTSQIESIWQEIIGELSPEILNINQSAKLCAKAFDLESQFCVPDEADLYSDEEKYTIYLKFRTLFIERLNSLNAICPCQKMPLLLQAFKEAHLPIPTQVFTYDLEQAPTIWNQLFEFFKSKKTTFTKIELKQQTPVQQSIVACEDLDHEVTSMVQDAYEYMCHQPDKTVALIVHDLANLKTKIEHCIKTVFEPSLLVASNEQDLSIDDFNITASSTLSQAPIVQSALNALSLNVVEIDFQNISQFLLSPFFQVEDTDENEDEPKIDSLHLQALCEARLREENTAQLTHKQWLFFLKRFAHLNDLSERFELFFSLNRSNAQLPSKWTQHFNKQLTALNWPGARVLTSLEHQQAKHWPQCIDELAQFDDLLGDIKIGQALSLLNQIVNNRQFHAQTPYSHLQVMGTLEAKGLTFDKAWIIQMDQSAWPSFASAHPFLPQALQQKYQLPHCSMERELSYTQELTDALAGIANDVTFSFSKTKDGQPVLPSQLLPDWKIIDIDKTNNQLNDLILNSDKQIDTQTWNQTSSFKPEQTTALPGSTYYIKTFNQCPLKAFMQYRGKVKALATANTGIQAFERGNIIHNCLEKIYRIVTNQISLKSYNDQKLLELITPKLEECLSEFNRTKLAPLSDTIIGLEQEYLSSLILLFLQAEQQRGEFTVLGIEARRTLEFGNIQLKMSVDRIDKLKDGSLYFWDYKSGKTDIKQWFSDPIKDPQLPIYALSEKNKDSVSGIGFAKITPTELLNNQVYQGVQKDNLIEIAPGLSSVEELKNDKKAKWMEKESFSECLEYWQQNIEHSIQLISDGDHPSKPCDLCTYCEYQSLCKEYLSDETILDDEIETGASL
ncbi:PD-(D/E)XK nuclease family protein [Marinicellulosiphila megalodicopiae]|uniref:PD-(D/E)XK nuclease family protein n=1 Tax=Marinicellulosiphila megalodicopiae TaxID=2724896 RepID=UPI003BAFCEA2